MILKFHPTYYDILSKNNLIWVGIFTCFLSLGLDYYLLEHYQLVWTSGHISQISAAIILSTIIKVVGLLLIRFHYNVDILELQENRLLIKSKSNRIKNTIYLKDIICWSEFAYEFTPEDPLESTIPFWKLTLYTNEMNYEINSLSHSNYDTLRTHLTANKPINMQAQILEEEHPKQLLFGQIISVPICFFGLLFYAHLHLMEMDLILIIGALVLSLFAPFILKVVY